MKTSYKILIVIIILVIVFIGLMILLNYNFNGNTIKDNGTIKIGFVGILSGDASIWGQSALAGAELAVNEANSAGGVNGKKVELVVEDDKLNNVESVNAYNKEINIDNVIGIIASGASGTVASSVPIAQAKGVPVIVATASAPKITKTGNYIFRVMPSDNYQGKFAADFIYNKLGKRKIAFLYINNDWGLGVKDSFEKELKNLNSELVYEDSFLENENDYRSYISKIKDSNADIVYLLIYPANVAALKQIKEMGLKTDIICGDAIDGSDVIKSPYADGIKYTVSKINSPDEFKSKLNALSGFENLKPNIAASTGYDGTKILINAIKKAGTDRAKIRDELAKTSYAGVSNPLIEFENGELKQATIEVKIIKNKEAVSYSQ